MEPLEQAKEELKRADHLIYVSLKYTRTCDVFKNIIERLVATLENGLDALLIALQEKNVIEQIPSQPGMKASILREKSNDTQLHMLVDFYLLLRQLNRAEFERSQEFRRHVTMTLHIADKKIDVTIDLLTEYYKQIQEGILYLEQCIQALRE